jgi:hypothetical protein
MMVASMTIPCATYPLGAADGRAGQVLRADLAAARGSDDAEVLAGDLAAAERRIDMLIEFGRAAT